MAVLGRVTGAQRPGSRQDAGPEEPRPATMPCTLPIRRALALAGLLPLLAAAQMHSDPALEALYAAGRHADLERAAASRLAANPGDAQAVLAFAMATLSAGNAWSAPAADARKAAIAHAEACIERQPKAYECHYALGVVLGAHLMGEGMLKAAGGAARVRALLIDAHLLAPHWYPARSALMEYYLHSPVLLGGSRSRALELARGAPQPAQARLLQARIASVEEMSEKMLRIFLDHRGGSDLALDDDARGWGSSVAFSLLNKGQATALAKSWFERVQRERPEQALGPYGIGRALAESGQHAEALAAYERCAKLRGAEMLPVDYRAGVALLALGRREEGQAALKRFADAGRGNKWLLDDAKKRLDASSNSGP